MGSHLVRTQTGLDLDWTCSALGSGSTVCLHTSPEWVQVHRFLAQTGPELDHGNFTPIARQQIQSVDDNQSTSFVV